MPEQHPSGLAERTRPDGTEVHRSCPNGWDASATAQFADDIGDGPPPRTIMGGQNSTVANSEDHAPGLTYRNMP